MKGGVARKAAEKVSSRWISLLDTDPSDEKARKAVTVFEPIIQRAIEEAVLEEREACAKAVCSYCSGVTGHDSVPHLHSTLGPWRHDSISSLGGGHARCRASHIRDRSTGSPAPVEPADSSPAPRSAQR